MRYELIIYWSKDDDCFVVEVPELPGCMADGQTYAEAVANAEIVIAEWIETARELGAEVLVLLTVAFGCIVAGVGLGLQDGHERSIRAGIRGRVT